MVSLGKLLNLYEFNIIFWKRGGNTGAQQDVWDDWAYVNIVIWGVADAKGLTNLSNCWI